MKVLHVLKDLSATSGGPPAAVIPMLGALGGRGIDSHVLATRSARDLPVLASDGSTIDLVSEGWLAPWWSAYSPQLRRLLISEIPACDLVHIHELWHYPHFVAAQLARRFCRPYVITLHGALQPWARNFKAVRKHLYMWVIQRRLLDNAGALITLTDAEYRGVRRLGFRTRLEVIPSGIDTSEFMRMPPQDALHASYPQLAGKRVILFLGRLHPIKGLDILAYAFAAVVRDRRFADTYLLLAGPDEDGYRAHIESILSNQGVADRAIFTGFLTGRERLAALARANLFVLPSHSEALSRSLLEAMACHVPVVITQGSGLPEVAAVGAGEVVDLDPDTLAAAIRRILGNESLQARMGSAGGRLVATRYTLDAVSKQMAELYRSVTS